MKEWLERYRKIQTLFYYINKIPSKIEKKRKYRKSSDNSKILFISIRNF
jgi:hypothetical protein